MPPPRPGPTQLAPSTPAGQGTEGADRDRGPDQAERQTQSPASTWCSAGPGLRRLVAFRGNAFTAGITTATLDPFRGYANAIRDELGDAVAVLDAFHVVRLGLQAMEETRLAYSSNCSVTGAARTIRSTRSATRSGPGPTTSRPARSNASRPGCRRASPHFEVTVSWRCYQQLRSAYAAASLVEGRKIALSIVDSFPGCPIPEIARLGRTLAAWRQQFLAYFTTERASNGGTEAINDIIELHRRIARGFRNPATTDYE